MKRKEQPWWCIWHAQGCRSVGRSLIKVPNTGEVKDDTEKVFSYSSSPSILLLQKLWHCRSVTTLKTYSLLSTDPNDFPIKSGLMYCSICTQSLCCIDSSQMSLPERSSRAVIQKGSALIGPNVMRPVHMLTKQSANNGTSAVARRKTRARD